MNTDKPAPVTSEQREWRQHTSDIKLAINSVIWTYAPGTMTLKKADELACAIIVKMTEAFDEEPTP